VSIQASIVTLKTLQVLDTRILQLQSELTDERANMDEKSERHVTLVSKIANLETAVDGMEGTRSELQGELRQLNIQVDKAREKLARCRNEKEANAAQREVEEIRRMHREREFEIQKLVGLIGDARADLAKVDAERASIAEQIDETQGEAVEKVRGLEAQLAEQLAKKAKALDGLSRSLRGRYETVSNKRGSGVAAAVGGSCSACHIEISPMMYQEIMRLQELFTCPSCLRILYYAEKAPGSDAPSERDADADDGASEEVPSGS
jgi:predicted  nucleic acid-binding Zn-ribbon protein